MKTQGKHSSRILLLGCFLWSVFVWNSEVASAEKIVPLKDGTIIQLTEKAINRKQTPESESVLWSVAVDRPQLPLLFTDSANVSLLFYFKPINKNFGEYHALRIADGKEQWMQPVWSHLSESLVSPVFLDEAIYIGHGLWLERINSDTGQTVARYAARTEIKALQARADGKIEIQAEDGTVKKWTLTFQNGRFSPQLAASGNLLLSISLWKRARWVLEDFDSDYLALHRLRHRNDAPLDPQVVLSGRDFDLRMAENVYRRAYEADPSNPAFALYIALTLHYQHRSAEAEIYKNEALQKSESFWEESLRLGGFVCEALELTQWADEFYAQGMARYIRDLPVPSKFAVLIEVLIHFGGTRSAAAGSFERALHVLELRRQIIPYTEGDAHFSREYARILRQKGQYDHAEIEARRVGKGPWMYYEYLTPSPLTFVGFLIVTALVGAGLILHNDARYRAEWWLALLAVTVIGLTAGMPGLQDALKILLLLLFLLGYVWAIAGFRRRRESLASSLWQVMCGFAFSSYIVLLTGLHIAYLSGHLISHAPLGGKVGEIIAIVAGIVIRRWLRSHGSCPIARFRQLRVFCTLWALIWGYFAWMHYFAVILSLEAPIPLPSMDVGHPNWKGYVDQAEQDFLFSHRDFRLMQAVVHQLNAEQEFARQIYLQMHDDARALNNLGVMSLHERHLKDARIYFEQALKQRPDCAPALYNLGVLLKDFTSIERAKNGDPWRVSVYQRYAPDKPWIAVPSLRQWAKSVYWSRGGFLVRGFTEEASNVLSTLHTLFQEI